MLHCSIANNSSINLLQMCLLFIILHIYFLLHKKTGMLTLFVWFLAYLQGHANLAICRALRLIKQQQEMNSKGYKSIRWWLPTSVFVHRQIRDCNALDLTVWSMWIPRSSSKMGGPASSTMANRSISGHRSILLIYQKFKLGWLLLALRWTALDRILFASNHSKQCWKFRRLDDFEVY